MKFDESRTDGHHAELAKLVGDWSGVTKTWFEPDVIADESPMSGTIRPVLDGRFVIHEYRGEMQGKAFEGVAIYGFDLSTNKFQAAWVDSFHMSTGILFSEDDPGERFSATGSYFAGEGEPRWGWRTELEVVDDDNIVITAYNIMPGEPEAIATKTRYSRKA
ncbi:MAG: DUF1579 domain-containing protein [Pyrinomonadaceae bacterium]